MTWQKHPGNPVIPEPPAGLALVEYRDHSVWREADGWYQLIGTGIVGMGGAVLLYRSHDLRHWDYLHPLCVANEHHIGGLWTGSMWECPDFFRLDDRHVLISSIWDAHNSHFAAAFVGAYRDHHFTPLVAQKLDYGDGHFYAPQSLSDRDGRRVVIGWVQEGRPKAAQRAAGWSGTMSLPRELTLGSDGWLRIQPVAELKSLRMDHVRVDPQGLLAEQPLILSHPEGNSLELEIELEPALGGCCGVAVRRAPDGKEETRIVYNTALRELVVERAYASLDDSTARTAHRAPLILAPSESLQLHIFLDHSVLEVFANARVSITSRIYPTRADSLGVALLAEREDARLLRFDAWRMRSIWTTERGHQCQ